MRKYFYQEINEKISTEKKELFEELIRCAGRYKHPLKSTSRQKAQMEIIRLLEMETCLAGFFQAADDLQKINGDLYFKIMEDSIRHLPS